MLESDLLKSWKPVPSKALLVTCRQIYAEARQVYQAVWKGTEFRVSLSDVGMGSIRDLEEWRLERVSKVRITDGGDEGAGGWFTTSSQEKTEYMLSGGVWTRISDPSSKSAMLVLLPPIRAEDVEDAGFVTERLKGTALYRCVDVTGMDAEMIAAVKRAAVKRNLRKEELVAMISEAFYC